MKDDTEAILQIRAFNRFYTRLIGLLDGHLLNSDYSLAEARILYEINAGKQVSASHIMAILNIDKGYLSRILKKFEKTGLIARQPSYTDARVTLIALTSKGLNLFNQLNEASNNQIDLLIKGLPPEKQRQLVQHMEAIQKILN